VSELLDGHSKRNPKRCFGVQNKGVGTVGLRQICKDIRSSDVLGGRAARKKSRRKRATGVQESQLGHGMQCHQEEGERPERGGGGLNRKSNPSKDEGNCYKIKANRKVH